jgi:hypothetical protein
MGGKDALVRAQDLDMREADNHCHDGARLGLNSKTGTGKTSGNSSGKAVRRHFRLERPTACPTGNILRD